MQGRKSSPVPHGSLQPSGVVILGREMSRHDPRRSVSQCSTYGSGSGILEVDMLSLKDRNLSWAIESCRRSASVSVLPGTSHFVKEVAGKVLYVLTLRDRHRTYLVPKKSESHLTTMPSSRSFIKVFDRPRASPLAQSYPLCPALKAVRPACQRFLYPGPSVYQIIGYPRAPGWDDVRSDGPQLGTNRIAAMQCFVWLVAAGFISLLRYLRQPARLPY